MRKVVTFGNRDEYGITLAVGIVILPQFLPETVNLDANNCVRFGIEVLWPAKSLYSDGVFLESFGVVASQGICSQKPQQLLERGGVPEGNRLQNALDLSLTR